MGNGLSLALAIAVPVAGGVVEGLLTQKDVKGWYTKLKKPTWNPPSWIFGPMWTVLYTSMGAASWIVFKQGGKPTVPLVLYGLQLALNFAWQPLFFKAKKLDIALVDSTAMVGMAAAATVAMSRSAGAQKIAPLMVPYLAWISFATALNYKLMELNPEYKSETLTKATAGFTEQAAEIKEQAAAQAEAAGEKLSEIKDQAVAKAEEASAAVAEKVEEAKEQAAEKVEEAAAELEAAKDAAAKE